MFFVCHQQVYMPTGAGTRFIDEFHYYAKAVPSHRDKIKRALQTVWVEKLWHIQQSKAGQVTKCPEPLHRGKHSLCDLRRMWVELGAAFGLTEAEETLRLQRRNARSHCSWRGCEFHHVEAPNPKALRLCAGCGDARYCNAECQRS